MTRKFFVGALIFLIGTLIFSATSAKKNDGVWRLDGNAAAELRNFRLVTDDWKIDFHGREPSRAGLDELHASASAQPSESSLPVLREKILSADPDAEIFIVDLRQESHGYANSLPVSWYVEKNRANVGKTSAEVERDEFERLQNLRGVETTFVPLGNSDTKSFKPVTIIPRVVSTERDAVEKLSMNYKRFSATDMIFPAPEVVDEYLLFLATLPENSWLHFHCHAGHGRTTTFLAMYDIMKNPSLPLEEICRRQYLLGGTNLLLEPEGDDFYSAAARDRAKNIRLFYEFVQGTRCGQIGLPWSKWLKEVAR